MLPTQPEYRIVPAAAGDLVQERIDVLVVEAQRLDGAGQVQDRVGDEGGQRADRAPEGVLVITEGEDDGELDAGR